MKATRHWMGWPLKLYLQGCSLALPWMAIHLMNHTWGWIADEIMPVLYLFLSLYSLSLLVWMHTTCYGAFHSLANLVRAMRTGDYSLRLRVDSVFDALGILQMELNLLADEMQQMRFSQAEETTRFQQLIDRLDVGVAAFDDRHRLLLANETLARWLKSPLEDLRNHPASEWHLAPFLEEAREYTASLSLPGKSSRFLIQRTTYRNQGRPYQLLVLADVGQSLREEERQAWKRLIRVISHELNNSLTPVISLSESLKKRVAQLALAEPDREQLTEALEVISRRAANLNRFVHDYSQLAKLPPPQPSPCSLRELISPLLSLDTGVPVTLLEHSDLRLRVDRAQIEQLFINLLKNAREAMLHRPGSIRISWHRETTKARICIDDDGPGLPEKENLFVPFFSSKPGGSGIGLVLARQIAENHGGSLELQNRSGGGCRAVVELPLDQQENT